MADLVGPILEVVKFIGRPAKKYLNYHRKFCNYVDDFRQAQAALLDRKADVEHKLQEEQRFEKKPKREVENWFKKVEEKISLAQSVEEKVSKGKYLCRTRLGKLVDEMTREIKEVHVEGLFPDGLVVNDPLATKLELPTGEFVGSTTPVEEIYEYLMDDEVRKIGVWGMGGIGKTTIVKNVYNKLLGENKLGKLIWTTVSQDFDIRRLQTSIADELQRGIADKRKEKLSDNDDIRAAQLSAMLRKQGRYVLILDDVWKSFLLSDCGIPEPKPEDGCKLILTTRQRDVVRSMDCREVEVRHLSEDEALQLFVSTVGRGVLSYPMIESTMKEIVEKCSGLPLAIVTVAGSMKGDFDPLSWQNALSELQGHVSSIQVSEDKLFGCLQFSYANLQPILRPCFLCCALYPEDYEIPKIDIIEHWLEAGLIDQMETRKAMHNRGHFFLQRLEESCLVERVWDDDCIKMHDLVRDMALRITDESPRFFVKAGLQLTELYDKHQLTEDLENVSFMRNNINMIPSYLLHSRCLKLTSLLFSGNSLEEIPDSFFDHMPNLKMLDLSFNPKIVNLPHSLSNLVNLTSLLLCCCRSLKTVPSLAKLVALRKLDLQKTSITEVPRGLEVLVNLRYLDLGYTERLKQIPNGIFFKLVHLQHLVLFPASLREEEIRELKKLELLIGQFTDFHGFCIYVGNKKSANEYYFVCLAELKYIAPFDSFLKHLADSFYSQLHNTKMIAFRGVEDSISVPSNIRQLELRNCGKLRSADDIGGLKDATDLRECTIIGCHRLEYLFSSWCAPLQTLESLHLEYLYDLKNLVADSTPPSPGSFSSLKKIVLYEIDGVQNLFSTISVLQDLHNLEVLKFDYCRRMEEIVASEEEEQEMINTNNLVKFMFPKLRVLRLWNLPELKSICSRNVIMVCNSLQKIQIGLCRKLERIPLYFSSLDNTQPSIPPYLKEFELYTEDKEWWECVEWSVHPDVKNFLQSIIKFTEKRVPFNLEVFL